MVASGQTSKCTTDDLLAIMEDCLNNYASDVHLFQSPLATWEVVKCRLPAGVMTSPEQLASTVRAVLDDLIDALQASESCDLNSPSVRRYIIADHLYRRGLKQTEICPSRLPLSKSQFYRERTETLVTLANYIQRWEQRIAECRKLKAIKTLAMLSPGGDIGLIGVDSLLANLTAALTTVEGPKLILLNGLGGLGKTAIAQAAVERVLHTDHFHALVWLNCQQDRFPGTGRPTVDVPLGDLDAFFNELLRQLREHAVSHADLFDLISAQVHDEQVTFDQVLSFLHEELDRQEPSRLPLSEKRSLVMDLLWAAPTLIVVDGLETAPVAQPLIDELARIASCTNTKVLITSRTRFSGCHYARHLEMTPLTRSDAIQLIQQYAAELGIESVRTTRLEDLGRIASAANGNPLIIEWAVNQLAAVPVREVLEDLSRVTGSGSDLYHYIYGRAWETLSASARQVLVSIARMPVSEATWEALKRHTGLCAADLNRSLQELVASSLVPVSTGPDALYQIGSMTRTFVLAACCASKTDHRPTIRSFRAAYRQPHAPTLPLEPGMIMPNVASARTVRKRSDDRSGRSSN